MSIFFPTFSATSSLFHHFHLSVFASISLRSCLCVLCLRSCLCACCVCVQVRRKKQAVLRGDQSASSGTMRSFVDWLCFFVFVVMQRPM
jgi:hypothetical protein